MRMIGLTVEDIIGLLGSAVLGVALSVLVVFLARRSMVKQQQKENSDENSEKAKNEMRGASGEPNGES